MEQSQSPVPKASFVCPLDCGIDSFAHTHPDGILNNVVPTEESSSPVPGDVKSESQCTFYEALSYLPEGKLIRRREWSDPEEHGLLRDSFLQIHRDGKFHNWIVSEGDMLALDWVVLA